MSSQEITKVADAQRKAESDAQRVYWQAARAAAAGGELPDPSGLLEARRLLGIDIETFEADAQRVAERFRLRTELEKRAEHVERLRQTEAQVQKHEAELTRAEERHEAKTAPMIRETKYLRRRIEGANTAEDSLARACPYPWLVNELGSLDRRIGECHSRRKELAGEIDSLEKQALRLRQQAVGDLADLPEPSKDQVFAGTGLEIPARERAVKQRLADLAERREARAVELKPALAAVEKLLETLDADRRAMRPRLIEP